MSGQKSVIKSFAWKAGERILVQGLGLAIQIILARLLLPEDFAAIALITAIVNYLGLFVQSGLSVAIVQKDDLTEKDVATLTSVSLLVATLLFIVLFVAAPVISEYYNVGDLVWPIRVMGLSLFLYSFNSIQTGLLSRKMMFRTIFFRSLMAIPLSGVVGIAMAFGGMGIWALVGYNMVNILSMVIFMNMVPELRLNLGFSLQSARCLYSFSLKILGTSLISAGGDTVRTMTIGKVYSPDKLAYYDRAYSYSALVTQVVNTSLASVLLPVFSRNQKDKSQLKNLARRSVGISSLVMMPMLVGVAITAEPLVSILLTDKWIACAPFLSLFCMLRIPGIITSIDRQVYLSLGKSQIGLYYECFLLAMNLMSLFLLIPYGIFAVAIGYTVIEFMGNFVLCIISSKVYDYSLRERFLDMIKSLSASVIMAACGIMLLFTEMSLWTLLISQVILCFSVYFSLQLLFRNEDLCYIIQRITKNK